MSEEKKIDLKDQMLSEDDLGQVSGGAKPQELMIIELEMRRRQQNTEGLTVNQKY